MTQRPISFVGVLAALAALCACKSPAARSAQGLAAKAQAAAAPADRPLVFGMTRPIGLTAAAFSAEQLSWYLSETLGSSAAAQVYDDADQLADALLGSQIDLAWMTPGSYLKASHRSPIVSLFKLSRGGATSYESVFISRAGKGIDSLAAAKGKSLVLVGIGSMSGRLLPIAHLKKAGIDPENYFSAILEAKDHEEACRLVLDGKADVGVTLSDLHPTGEGIADGCREAKMDPKSFTVIEHVGAIPNDIIAVRPGLDKAMVERLRSAFANMDQSESGRAELKNIFHADGFAPASDQDFATLRALAGE